MATAKSTTGTTTTAPATGTAAPAGAPARRASDLTTQPAGVARVVRVNNAFWHPAPEGVAAMTEDGRVMVNNDNVRTVLAGASDAELERFADLGWIALDGYTPDPNRATT